MLRDVLATPYLPLVESYSMSTFQNKSVRQPKYAGELYPANPDELRADIHQAIDVAKKSTTPIIPNIKTLILPYGNYRDTLQVQAEAYKQIMSVRYDMVVFISPAADVFHRLVMSGYGAFQTPLGQVEINDYTRNELCDEDDDFFISEEGLPKGHAVEVQLPILQETLGKFVPLRIVPIIIGDQTVDLCNEAASALSEVLRIKNALLIALNNFVYTKENEPLIKSHFDMLVDQDYGALLRQAVIHGKSLGSGLGTVAIAAKVSQELGAKNFHTLAQEQSREKLYLSACFSK